MTNKPIDSVPSQYRQRGYAKPYSRWHWENLPPYCYMIDLDCVEWRPSKGIEALIETRATDTFLNKFQHGIITSIAQAMNVPAYFVRHNPELTQFKVMNLATEQEKIMTAEDYKNFLKYL